MPNIAIIVLFDEKGFAFAEFFLLSVTPATPNVHDLCHYAQMLRKLLPNRL